jgi:hypothetical protein
VIMYSKFSKLLQQRSTKSWLYSCFPPSPASWPLVGYVQALQMVEIEVDQVMLVFLLPEPEYGWLCTASLANCYNRGQPSHACIFLLPDPEYNGVWMINMYSKFSKWLQQRSTKSCFRPPAYGWLCTTSVGNCCTMQRSTNSCL